MNWLIKNNEKIVPRAKESLERSILQLLIRRLV
jgi:hypothetical protein